MKILKNHAIGVCPNTGRTKYEYLIFDVNNKTQGSIKGTFEDVASFASINGLERISPMEAHRQGYFNFEKSLNIPLPF